MGKWSNLTAQQKAAVIKFAMDNGVSDINSIRDTYNLYSASTWSSEQENKDYDMAAAKAAGIKADYRGHYPDTFKKPNHPTFSTESMYSDPIIKGGTWGEDYTSFTPSEFQKRNWAREEMLEALKNQGDGNVALNYGEGGKIHIKPSKRGTFTAAATKHGKSVQEFARQVLANKENYSSAMVKKANFARNAAKWHSTGGPLYPFSFSGYIPTVRYADGGQQFIPNKNIQNRRVWLNKGTKYQKQIQGTVNLQNITDKLNPLGPDTQYIWDDAEHNSYSAFRRNPDYREPVVPSFQVGPQALSVKPVEIPKITVSIPEPQIELPGKWIQIGTEWNPAYGYETFHLENTPKYGIKYYSVPGTINAGQGSFAVQDSTVMGISSDELSKRVFDYKTNHGGWDSFTTP